MVVLDTCSIIELCKKSPQFSTKTTKAMDAGGYILSISFAEIACKIKLGKLAMDISADKLFMEFKEISNVRFVDISVEHWLDSINLAWPENKDPADRIITAFAMQNDLAIVTSDQKIKKFYKKVIW